MYGFQIFIFIAQPCTKDGLPLPKGAPPSPVDPVDFDNPFFPFQNRHEFDWAEHYFKDLGASKKCIGKGLDLWLSSTLQTGGQVPWQNAKEMYATIDEIQEGVVPWNTVTFKYNKPTTPNSPQWMRETYELCCRDVRLLLQSQLKNPEYKDHFEYNAYQEFNEGGDRIFSNFMSGDWAWSQCVRIYIPLIAVYCMLTSNFSRISSPETPKTAGVCSFL